jgi:hypothetical protein
MTKTTKESEKKGDIPMTKFFLRYVRYILTTLAAVGFGIRPN